MASLLALKDRKTGECAGILRSVTGDLGASCEGRGCGALRVAGGGRGSFLVSAYVSVRLLGWDSTSADCAALCRIMRRIT